MAFRLSLLLLALLLTSSIYLAASRGGGSHINKEIHNNNNNNNNNNRNNKHVNRADPEVFEDEFDYRDHAYLERLRKTKRITSLSAEDIKNSEEKKVHILFCTS